MASEISENKSTPRTVQMGAFIVSYLLLSGHMMQLYSFVFGTFPVYRITLVLLAIYTVFRYGLKLLKKDCLFVCIILSFFAIDFVLKNNSSLSQLFGSFLVYGMAAFIISYCQYEYIYIFRWIERLGFLWIAAFTIKNGINFGIYGGMSIGYLLFPIIVCLLLLLRIEKEHRITRIALLVYMMFMLLMYSSRGPLLCIVLFFIILGYSQSYKAKYRIALIVLLSVVFIVIININELFYLINRILPHRISFIEKSILLMEQENDITNGRISILTSIFYEYKWYDFIFGIGIGTYQSTHLTFGYTHNLIFSIMLDFGFVGLAYILYVLASSLKYIYIKSDSFCIYLFSISVFPLMFSGEYWKSFAFWFFVFTYTKIDMKSIRQINKMRSY